METRRTFLAGLVLIGAAAGLAADSSNAQNPNPVDPHKPPSEGEGPTFPNADKKILEENDKDMKKKVEKLYQLASDLRDEVEKTDSSKVFSLNLTKKAEEIEKLARDIKNRSKG